MDPGRRAMIYGRKSPPRRDIASPRRDPNTRITKPTRSEPSKPPPPRASTAAAATYLSSDEQSRRFVADEDKFVLKQSKKKADIRVREGRAKPIDLLAFNLRFIDDDRDVFDDHDADIDIEVPNPDIVIEGLDLAQLEELEGDLESYRTLETNEKNIQYWEALQSLCSEKKAKLKPAGPEGRAVSSVSADVDKILGPKNLEQLEKLEGQIKAKLWSNEVVDTDYWEQLLKNLKSYKAKARLNEIYKAIKDSRVNLLNDRNADRAEASGTAGQAVTAASKSKTTAPTAVIQSTSAASSSSSAAPGTARFTSTGEDDFSQATKALYEREVARGVSENEEVFTAEESVSSGAKPQWADKYRPRKPRYFNRVQMGYEWNKYNQTHYDQDNPPPKVVQGYKFNIFYPELIDKTKAPTFKIIREHGRRRGESFAAAGEDDTCLIRFIAGPPYEDIAFRIVDREWDYSAKKDRGFKSSFDKGILQLHFQFKKIYYRK